MLITFCISAYKEDEYLINIVKKLVNQEHKKFNCIIQDNSVGGKFKKILNTIKGLPNFLYDKKNTDGLSDSRNRCADIAKTKYIYFLDDDIDIETDFTKTVEKYILYHRCPDVVVGKVLPEWNNKQRPEWIQDGMLGLISIVNLGEQPLKYRQGKFTWAAGANICFERESFVEAGGFSIKLGRDKNFDSLLSEEENQLIRKMHKQNAYILYVPQIVVKHFIKDEKLTKNWMIKRVAWQAVSDVLCEQSWYDNKDIEDVLIKDASMSLYNKEAENFSKYLSKVRYLCYKMLKGEI